MKRRDLLKTAMYGAAGLALRRSADALSPADSHSIPIIDAHIHLFDPSRPGGVPWPEKDDTVLYRTALPDRYTTVISSLGVVGAIAIEASPLTGDNDWLLNVVAANPIIVGAIGDLVPSDTKFSRELERLHSNSLFLGIRYGNLWKRDLTSDMHKPGFTEALKLLEQAQLVLETANPDLNLIRGITDVADRLSNLRIVIDHLPHATLPTGPSEQKEYWSHLTHLSENQNIYVKLSEIPVIAEDKLVTDLSYYQAGLDRLWNIFGEGRVVFGSDWPNSDHVTGYRETLGIVRSYMATKSNAAQQGYFWKNSIAAYKWKPRLASQPSLA